MVSGLTLVFLLISLLNTLVTNMIIIGFLSIFNTSKGKFYHRGQNLFICTLANQFPYQDLLKSLHFLYFMHLSIYRYSFISSLISIPL